MNCKISCQVNQKGDRQSAPNGTPIKIKAERIMRRTGARSPGNQVPSILHLLGPILRRAHGSQQALGRVSKIFCGHPNRFPLAFALLQSSLNQSARNKPWPLPATKETGGVDESSTPPALTYLRLVTAGTGSTAVSGRAATRLPRLRCSRYSKHDNSNQQYYFERFHRLLL
jgi:hypothetical protein